MAKLKPMNPTVNYEGAWKELKEKCGNTIIEPIEGEYLKDVQKRLKEVEMTKKEALKNVIKAIVKNICGKAYDNGENGLMFVTDQYIDRKANEIIKEVEIRFKLGD